MNSIALIPNLVGRIADQYRMNDRIYAITFNLTNENELIGIAHFDIPYACANNQRNRDKIIRQILLVRKPGESEWRIGEFGPTCDRPKIPKLLESDLPKDVNTVIKFSESKDRPNCGPREKDKC